MRCFLDICLEGTHIERITCLTFRRAVISLAVMDDKEADKEAKDDREVAETEMEEDKGSAVDGGKEKEDDIGSPFQWMDTVYV